MAAVIFLFAARRIAVRAIAVLTAVSIVVRVSVLTVVSGMIRGWAWPPVAVAVVIGPRRLVPVVAAIVGMRPIHVSAVHVSTIHVSTIHVSMVHIT